MIALLTKVPITLWLAIAVGVWGSFGHIKAHRLQSAWDTAKLQQAEIARESELAARKAEFLKAQAAREVQDAVFNRVKATKTAITNLTGTNRRLQDALTAAKVTRTSANAEAICGVDGARGEVIERLLAESAGLAREGGERVRELSDQVTGLQDFTNRVCVNANKQTTD